MKQDTVKINVAHVWLLCWIDSQVRFCGGPLVFCVVFEVITILLIDLLKLNLPC